MAGLTGVVGDGVLALRTLRRAWGLNNVVGGVAAVFGLAMTVGVKGKKIPRI